MYKDIEHSLSISNVSYGHGQVQAMPGKTASSGIGIWLEHVWPVMCRRAVHSLAERTDTNAFYNNDTASDMSAFHDVMRNNALVPHVVSVRQKTVPI